MLDNVPLDALRRVVRSVAVLREFDENKAILLLRIRFPFRLVGVLNFEEGERVLDGVDLALDEGRLSRVELALRLRRFNLDDLLVVICDEASSHQPRDDGSNDATTHPQSLCIASRTPTHTP